MHLLTKELINLYEMRHRGLKLGDACIYTASLTTEYLWAVGVCLSCPFLLLRTGDAINQRFTCFYTRWMLATYRCLN